MQKLVGFCLEFGFSSNDASCELCGALGTDRESLVLSYIWPHDRAQDMKKIVEQLRMKGETQYL